MKIYIDKNSEVTVYRQIANAILRDIKTKDLKPGDKLPTERELSNDLKLARGTIKRAYEYLASERIVEMHQGRGTFIVEEHEIHLESRKDKAIQAMKSLLKKLSHLRFDLGEIEALFQLVIRDYEEGQMSIQIAGVDCNPEALSIFDRQIRFLSKSKMGRFLLDDIRNNSGEDQLLKNYDVILTTHTHYKELNSLLPNLKKKIVQVAVAPSQETIVKIAQLPKNAKLGIITMSEAFREIISSKLKDLGVKVKDIQYIYEFELHKFPEFITHCNYIITPSKCWLEERSELDCYFNNFFKKNGQVIRFDYKIEKSAMIYLENRIIEALLKIAKK